MKSLKTKLVLSTCMITIVCLCILSGISYFKSSGIVEDTTGNTYTVMAQKCGTEIESWLKEQAQIIVNEKQSIEIQDHYEPEYLSAYLAPIVNEYNTNGYIYDLYFTSTENVMSAGSGYVPDNNIDFTQRDWYKKACETDGLYYSSPYLDADSGKIVITISTQVRQQDTLKGVLALDIFVDTLVDIVAREEVPEDSYVFILDQNNGVVNHPNDAFGYVEDEPVALDQLEGNPYADLQAAIAEKKDHVSLTDYDGTQRTLYISNISSCNWNIVVAISNAVTGATLRSLLWGFVIAIAISVVLCIIVTLMITMQITKPIAVLTKVLASGDFSKDIEVKSKDEVGRLSVGFNTLMQKLRGLLQISTQAVQDLEQMSENLGLISKGVVEGAATVNSGMESIVDSMNHQFAGVSEGKDQLQIFEDSIGHFQKQFENMAQQIQSSVNRLDTSAKAAVNLQNTTNQSVSNMGKISEQVRQLEENSNDINKIVATITGISSQTNLLALNASIEAARAGEAGKGFAVVAEEIRVLSTQTAEATQDISALVYSIQETIHGTVNAIDESMVLFQENEEISNEVLDVFESIKESIDSLGESTRELTTALEQFVGSEEIIMSTFEAIDQSVNDCVTSSNDAQSAAQNQSETVEKLSDSMQELHVLASDLKDRLNEF